MRSWATSCRTCSRDPSPRVQLNDLRAAVEQWTGTYRQRCWLRQLNPYANREQEDRALRVIARMNGTPFPSTAPAHRPMAARSDSDSQRLTRGIPLVHCWFAPPPSVTSGSVVRSA